MKIDWVMICRDIRESPNGMDLLGIEQDGVFTPDEPPPWTLEVLFGVHAVSQYHEMAEDSDHVFKISAYDENMNLVAEGTQSIRLFARDDEFHYPGWQGSGVTPIKMRFDIIATGTYMFNVALDGGDPISVFYRVLPYSEFGRYFPV